MSFSFDINIGDDRDEVRLEIQDTDGDAYFFDNEVIDFILTEEGSVGAAVVRCLENMIAQLSRPDFSTDWISVKNSTGIDGLKETLALKKQKYGLGASATISVIHPYRVDSKQTSDDDYTG